MIYRVSSAILGDDLQDAPDDIQSEMYQKAQRVLQVMLDPSWEMIYASWDSADKSHEEVYCDMINAALSVGLPDD